jgi:hypothetical protein
MSIFPSCPECSKGARRQHYGNSLLHEVVEDPISASGWCQLSVAKPKAALTGRLSIPRRFVEGPGVATLMFASGT